MSRVLDYEFFRYANNVLEIEHEIKLLRRYAKRMNKENAHVATYVYLILVRSLISLAKFVYNKLVPHIAKEYRFYCIELLNSNKSKYVENMCELVKMDFRICIGLVRAIVDNVSNIVDKFKVKYKAIVDVLSRINSFIEEFERDPDVKLDEIARRLAEREEEFLRMKENLEKFIDSVLKLLEDRGLLVRIERAGTTIYTCTVCGKKFISKMDYVNHMINEHISTETLSESESEG